jgi:hypothetical protein
MPKHTKLGDAALPYPPNTASRGDAVDGSPPWNGFVRSPHGVLHQPVGERALLHGRFSPSATPMLTVDSGDRIRAWLPDVA